MGNMYGVVLIFNVKLSDYYLMDYYLIDPITVLYSRLDSGNKVHCHYFQYVGYSLLTDNVLVRPLLALVMYHNLDV